MDLENQAGSCNTKAEPDYSTHATIIGYAAWTSING